VIKPYTGNYWCGAIERANAEGDWGWLAEWISRRFNVFVNGDWVYMHRPEIRRPGWSDGSWAMWYKSQLIADNRIWHGQDGEEPPPIICLKVVMHCFFLSVPETPEQLARLRGRDNSADEATPRLQTPAIERTLESPTPINRTAAKVVGLNSEPRNP
jgi:hypothetical protein